MEGCEGAACRCLVLLQCVLRIVLALVGTFDGSANAVAQCGNPEEIAPQLAQPLNSCALALLHLSHWLCVPIQAINMRVDEECQ